MNIKTLGWVTLALGTIGIAGAAALHTPAKPSPAAEQSAATQGGSVTVLGYESIGAKKNALTPADFREQMRYLKESGMTPISLQDFLGWRAGDKKLPAKPVLLTFEKADTDFMTSALPVLRECGYPFVLFVDTRYLGSVPGYISERDLGVVSRGGGSVGVCTLSPETAKEWQQAELRGNEATETLAESELAAPARRLEDLCGSPCGIFSHFAGNTDVSVLRELVRVGYTAAFSRTDGKVTKNAPGYLLPRYMVKGNTDFSRALGLASPLPPAEEEAPVSEPPATPAAPATSPSTTTPATSPTAAPRPLPTDLSIEDDCVAIDDEEEEEAPATPATAPVKPVTSVPASPAVQPTQPTSPSPTDGSVLEEIPATPVIPTYANLGTRTEGGHWVTASFQQPLVPREQTRVAVLGYHNFSNTKSVSDMRMRTSEFCQQMQYIKDAGISVITMQDFMEWRFGNRQLPERCVLITIDDGWKSVYTDAYPVLRAYGYPFTIFLYNRYIDVKGDSMTTAQIKEMQACGATVGSHSTNHLYPRSWKRLAKDPEAYSAQIQKEILDSGTNLGKKFGPCTAYCYPGGYNTPQMIEALEGSPFRVAFTVLEQKVTCTESPFEVHRYMVFGTDARIFRRAVNFDGEAGVKPTSEGIAAAAAPARAFFPKAFEGVAEPAAQTKSPAKNGKARNTAPATPAAQDAPATAPATEETATEAPAEAPTAEEAPATPAKGKGKNRKKSRASR